MSSDIHQPEDDDVTGFPDADTWDMRPRFKLRQIGMNGALFLAIDLLSDPLPILSEGFVGLELKGGTSRDDAMVRLDQLTDMIAFMTYTDSEPEWNSTPGQSDCKPPIA